MVHAARFSCLLPEGHTLAGGTEAKEGLRSLSISCGIGSSISSSMSSSIALARGVASRLLQGCSNAPASLQLVTRLADFPEISWRFPGGFMEGERLFTSGISRASRTFLRFAKT